MPEKPNNSNDPTVKQPTLDDGTFTFKNSSGGSEGSGSEASGEIDLDDLGEIDLDDLLDSDDFGFEIDEDWYGHITLEGQAGEIYNSFSQSFGLSKKALSEATEEEIQRLCESIEIANTHGAKIEDAQKAYDAAKHDVDYYKGILNGNAYGYDGATLYGVFKDKTLTLVDYPEYKDKLQAKKDYYQSVIDDPTKSETAKTYAKTKLAEVEAYEKLASTFEMDFPEHEKLLAEAKEKLQKASSELESLKKQLADANGVIDGFQDKEDPYSEFRRKNAISFGFNSSKTKGKSITSSAHEAQEFLLPMATKQWNAMNDKQRAIIQYYSGSFNWCNEPLRGIKYSGSNMPKWNPSHNYYTAKYGGDIVAEFRDAVTELTGAISQCRLEHDMWFQRGLGDLDVQLGETIKQRIQKHGADSVVGIKFRHKNFASMGASKGTGFSHQAVIMNLYCPKGTQCYYSGSGYGSDYGLGENEMLLNRGYSMVIRKAEVKDGKYYIDVDVILDSNTDEVLAQDLDYASAFA